MRFCKLELEFAGVVTVGKQAGRVTVDVMRRRKAAGKLDALHIASMDGHVAVKKDMN